MRWQRAAVALAASALIVGGIVVTARADAGTSICDKYGSARTAGGYVVQNNLWGADTPQCVTVSGDGFSVTTSQANKPTNGAPASYPSIFWGCHYATCTNGFTPIQASSAAFAKVRTSAEFGYVEQGAYDASYDIWFDPTPRTDGQNTGAELMIWTKRLGGVQPVGSKVATVSIAGTDWDVWFGNIGWNVVSYVRVTPGTSISTAVADFYSDAVGRGYAQQSWYLTSVQAGFEPWIGGAGLAITSFSVTTDGAPAPTGSSSSPAPSPSGAPSSSTSTGPSGGSGTSSPGPSATGAPSPSASAPAGAAPAGCTISTRRDEWQGGFVRYVTVTNTGSTALTGWTLSLQVGDGQQLTSGWSATWHQVGRLVTATNLDYNAALAPGASVSVGFQGTWASADPDPAQWALNGTGCTTT